MFAGLTAKIGKWTRLAESRRLWRWLLRRMGERQKHLPKKGLVPGHLGGADLRMSMRIHKHVLDFIKVSRSFSRLQKKDSNRDLSRENTDSVPTVLQRTQLLWDWPALTQHSTSETSGIQSTRDARKVGKRSPPSPNDWPHPRPFPTLSSVEKQATH